MHKSDPAVAQFVATLNDMRWQFARIGNNYNQIVKQVNTHFSSTAIPVQLSILIGYTRQLKSLSIQMLELSKKIEQQWLQK